ncbi:MULTISPECIES: OmpA/MotB family protein [Mucilaginibacter]|jgi:chemotaxis protein MotB|uniref:OmpA/MotB family protein n=1 Tax=Mucilaginibacter TaxID=423349 RepID=UPI0008715CEE|nr:MULTISPECIES: flagellar motor protein MotB [Mucilaginibacter]NVM64284.1 chemotaxis protein MotB [Mucilaginibacter sp. SG538B]SCW76378.1 chemotaxis protein MotB [Mucilaginibacter sp. NFR10]
MKYRISILALLVTAVLGQSCVSSKKYKELDANYTQLQNSTKDLSIKYQTSEQALAVARGRNKSLEEQIEQQKTNVTALQDALNKCLNSSSQGNVNISKLVDEINASNRYIQQLVNAKNKSDSLNMVLTNNLTRSLTPQETQDVDVKVLKGVVYISLSDNMLYKSGSYEISDKAGATLSKIAKIIMDYSNYDVLIEGNTDNVPISQKNIRNNWDLSALRASSVVQALQTTYQVDPKRLTAGGRGEYNPIADNSTPSGKAQNRRTQIIITPKLDQFMDLIGKAPADQPAPPKQ